MTGVQAGVGAIVLLAVIIAIRLWWRSSVAWSLHLLAAIACAALAVMQRSVVWLFVFAVLAVGYSRVALAGLRLRRASEQ